MSTAMTFPPPEHPSQMPTHYPVLERRHGDNAWKMPSTGERRWSSVPVRRCPTRVTGPSN